MTIAQPQRRVQLFSALDPFEGFVRQLNPVFWLPLTESSGSLADNALYTAAPGAELLTNGDFEAGVLTPWTVINSPPTAAVVSYNGSQQAHVISDAPFEGIIQGTVSVPNAGDTVTAEFDLDIVTGTVRYRLESTDDIETYAAGGHKAERAIVTTTFPDFRLDTNSGVGEFYADNASLKKTGELDGLIAGTTTLGQNGRSGGNHAYLFDGATSLLTVTNRASIQGLTDFSLWALFNPSDAGEGDSGTLFAKDGEFELRFNSASRDLIATVNYGTTNASATTSTTLSTDAWHTVGLRIDDSSKTIDIFVDGVEASYASQTAGAGSRASNTNDLIVGNNAAINQTLAGLLDEVLVVDRILTPNEFALLHRLA